ncbi:Phosphate regulon transcriptional regulatory protein PhoB (SphR) [Clostridiaceae bacterium JG1575]|nr:Phosphate regulon transcriptional regulatory protein PhoB (SphR) [Clostridiaceae bacterium JG1575]
MLSILLADRNDEFRQKLKNVLKNTYKVYEADNGIEAIELSEREPISIYLVSANIPFILEPNFLGRFGGLSMSPILVYGDCKEIPNLDQFAFIHQLGDLKSPDQIARRVNLHRVHHYGTSDNGRFFRLEGMEIDYLAKKLRIDGKDMKLTPKEFDLLVFLLINSGNHYSREQLLQRVWEYDFLGDSRTIDTHVKSLRNKLGDYRHMVITIWGKGYKIELPDPDDLTE